MKGLLAGIRVIDFTWIGAGSYTTKLLADLGADVIKIETSKRLDTLRVTKPFKDGVVGVNRSGYFADRNSSKRSVTINMKHPKGLEIVRKLMTQGDLIANNFTPGVMEKLGLGYEDVRKISERIVYVAMSVQGAEGPEKNDLGYGLTITALTGFQHLIGLADRQPAGTGTNYPDHIPNPAHAAFAILAAVRHQRRTNQGQYIDIAQIEPTLCMIGPSLMNYLVNDEIETRNGNRHRTNAPQGVYQTRGEDRWITISIQTDAQWQSLVETLGLTVSFDATTHAQRMAHHDEIDALISASTRTEDAAQLSERLQQKGIAAGPVLDTRDVVQNDEQLQWRGHWVTLNHPEVGPSLYNNAPYRLSDSSAQPWMPAPCLGEHTDEVLLDVLSCSQEEIDALRADDVLS